MQNNFHNNVSLLPISKKLKDIYLAWYEFSIKIPKTHKYSLGQKIDNLFVEAMEAVTTAGFLQPQEKLPWIRLAIRKTDTLKIFLMILWETKSIDDKKYILLSEKLNEIGKMLGGWHNQIQNLKQNSARK
jgi:hypothetical protein